MRSIYTIIIFLTITTCFSVSAQQINAVPVQKITALKLLTSDNKAAGITLNKPSVLVFLSPECPLCKNYAPVLNSLKEKYPQVEFYGIFPGKSYSLAEINAYKQDYKIGFKLLMDPLKVLTNYVHATTTPQVIFIKPTGSVLYNGLIDNWVVSLGQQRQIVTKHYLDAAISQFTQNKPIEVKNTRPIGCLINDI